MKDLYDDNDDDLVIKTDQLFLPNRQAKSKPDRKMTFIESLPFPYFKFFS